MDEGSKKFNKCLLYILIFLMVFTGSTITILLKNLEKIKSLGREFKTHRWFITFGMFLGEFISFFYVYKLKQRKKKLNENRIEEQGDTVQEPLREQAYKRPPIPSNLFFSITAGADLIASTMNIFGLSYLTSSIYQMMRGLQLFPICILSLIILKKPIYRHAILGICFLVIGCFLIGITGYNKDKEEGKKGLIGIFLICISQIFTSLENIIQEIFIKKYEVCPFQLIGFEGLWGGTLYIVLLIIFQNISCDHFNDSLKEKICSYNDKDKYHLEDSIFAFKQFGDKISILGIYIFYILSIFLYNIVKINLIKLTSSTDKVVVDFIRSVFIWLFFLCFEPVKGTKESFDFLQLSGLCLIIIGNLIYNEFIVISFWKLNYYTRDNIAKRKEEEKRNKMIVKNGEEDLYISIDGKDYSNYQGKSNSTNLNEDSESNGNISS